MIAVIAANMGTVRLSRQRASTQNNTRYQILSCELVRESKIERTVQQRPLTGSADTGLNSKLTGVGLLPGEETELDVGDSGNVVGHC